MIGGVRAVHTGTKAEPYGGMSIGVDVIDVKIPITTHHKVPLNLHGV